MKRTLAFSLAALLAVMTAPLTKAADIVDTAVAAGQFKTLAAAVGAADLADALKGKGPFTVFAPTDEAFAKLPKGTVETLLKPENKAKLQAILKYHVVGAEVPASEAVKLNGAVTLNGQRIDIKTEQSTVMIDSATVIKTDIECDNGIIHVIDSVILPADKNIVETAAKAGNFGTLIAAAKAAGLAGALTGEDSLTVFAPTDDAFGKLPEGTVASLLKPENKQQLVKILKYHVVAGRVYSDQAVKAGSAKTLAGSPITIKANNQGAMVNKAGLVATDIDASNGVIHVIDSVLMPPADTADNSDHSSHRENVAAAIRKGSELFNAGHHAACANLYQKTLHGLMDSEVEGSVKSHVSTVLTSAKSQHCETSRAWTLRRGMDQAYRSLASSN